MGTVLEVQLDSPINLARSSPFPLNTCGPPGPHISLTSLPWACHHCELLPMRVCLWMIISLPAPGTAPYWHILCVLASSLTTFLKPKASPSQISQLRTLQRSDGKPAPQNLGSLPHSFQGQHTCVILPRPSEHCCYQSCPVHSKAGTAP